MKSAKLNRKWNNIHRQYVAELRQLEEQLFPVCIESSPMTYWDESLWDSIEMFGLVLDEDTAHLESLKGFWVDQDTGERRGQGYIPGSIPDVTFTCIDNPPRDEAAWDARPV